MEDSTPSLKENDDTMSRVIEEAKGYASDLSLRLANWWSALIPLSIESTPPAQATQQTATPESKKIEVLRESWYSERELKRKSTTAQALEASQDGEEPMEITIWLLGKKYSITTQDFIKGNQSCLNQLIEDFKSQPWFTYRHHFPQLKPASFTTDSGWGCMLRTGQCLLAQALIRHRLGKDWGLKDIQEPAARDEYLKMMELFLDDMSPRCPFSIHRIALLGKQLGNEIGEWFGPNTMAQVLSSLIRDFPELGLRVYVNADGTIYKSSILLPDNSAFKPILILLPIRLGVDSFNPVYHAAIKQYFSFSQIIGIAGGKPSSSFFFMGVEDDEIIYLDPHHSRPAINLKSPVEWAVEVNRQYSTHLSLRTSLATIVPSPANLALGHSILAC
ncbi:Cysteine protease atg4, variant 2 [Entomophthora muscae]|uniref:Cysteine protease atg4, variant 2 n=1 Tax=Entomophthora muscae TaxID=34485 RepID=A0ACC2RV14_9FUNG|nr:Cysteine protease atg4, variant 2 [Entomophthora muscae]